MSLNHFHAGNEFKEEKENAPRQNRARSLSQRGVARQFLSQSKFALAKQ